MNIRRKILKALMKIDPFLNPPNISRNMHQPIEKPEIKEIK